MQRPESESNIHNMVAICTRNGNPRNGIYENIFTTSTTDKYKADSSLVISYLVKQLWHMTTAYQTVSSFFHDGVII